EERPDFTVWEKLATKLDTTTVWDKLAVSLDRYELFIWWRNTILKSTAVILLLLGSYFTYQNFNKKTSFSDKQQPTLNNNLNYGFASLLGANQNVFSAFTHADFKEKENPNSNSTQATRNNISNAIFSAKKSLLNSSQNNKNESNVYASTNELKHYNFLPVKNLEVLKSNSNRRLNTNLNNYTISAKDISTHTNSKEFLVKKANNKILFNKRRFTSRPNNGINTKRLYVGANIGFKKQGLFTSYAQNTPLKDYKKKSLLDFGTNFGAILGIIISDKLSIESNIVFNSTAGHKRTYSFEDRTFEEHLNLNYTSASLIAKKTNNRSTFDNRLYSTNFFGGAYISKLSSENTIINEIELNTNQFNSIDYGIILGIEQDRYITNNIVITPGVRYNQGVANITNENSAFSSARNFSIEFNVGVKYIFSK
ncbi:MAG: hypothetical protein ACPGSO_05455, partial [Vicingaceae bacterium]